MAYSVERRGNFRTFLSAFLTVLKAGTLDCCTSASLHGTTRKFDVQDECPANTRLSVWTSATTTEGKEDDTDRGAPKSLTENYFQPSTKLAISEVSKALFS
ncbi:hypothetical protein BKA93DRAFT_149218 [Sparassis latifolia]